MTIHKVSSFLCVNGVDTERRPMVRDSPVSFQPFFPPSASRGLRDARVCRRLHYPISLILANSDLVSPEPFFLFFYSCYFVYGAYLLLVDADRRGM